MIVEVKFIANGINVKVNHDDPVVRHMCGALAFADRLHNLGKKQKATEIKTYLRTQCDYICLYDHRLLNSEDQLMTLIEMRKTYRAAKQYQDADEIREFLAKECNTLLQDTNEGTVWRCSNLINNE